MKNENKVTIKQKKIMIHKFSRYLLTLVALFAMTAGAWAEDLYEEFTTNTGASVYTGEHFKITPYALGVGGSYGFCIEYYFPATIEALNGETITKVEFTTSDTEGLLSDDGTVTYNGKVATVSDVNATSMTVIAENYIYITAVKVYYTAGPEVTFNDAKTTASFEMPASDLTVDYELVRDMAISMPITVGDGNDGYRIRLKKSEQNPGKFEPADTDVAGMMALIKVHDAIENEDLIFFNLGGSVDCAVSIYAIDDNDQPVGDPVAFQDLVPGRYIAKATAATGSTYDGETANSNVFVLFQGFELEIAAGEYATFYKEEPLYVEDEDAKLYTISSVTDTEAVLSEQIIVAPALTPLLVYNSSDETKTFLLIASVEEADDVTPAEEFKGTLVAKTFSEDDMAAANHFVLTAAQAFVWVKNAGTIAANRCWLELPISAASNARVIVFGDATGIDGISDISGKSGDWFDLNGRKLQKMPTKKGIYILNGRKVVVK